MNGTPFTKLQRRETRKKKNHKKKETKKVFY